MGFNMQNISKIVQLAKAVKSPQQAKQMLLEALSKKNPQFASYVKQSMESGKSFIDCLKENVLNGTVTPQNIEDVKKGYKLAQGLGLTQKVPNSVWNEIDDTIKNGNARDSGGGFSGF